MATWGFLHGMEYQKLFDQCKRNDRSAQKALYDHFKGRLMGLCRRYTKDHDDAQDMLQETFIKIFSRISQVEKADGLEAWMKTIAVNTAIDHYNKKKRTMMTSSEDEVNIADTAYELILDNLTDEYLIRVINELPEGSRIVFNLAVVEGYSHAEIANLIGISESTSRSQLHYAKQLLKEKLNRLGIQRYEKFA
jgi:RNA polymerase sigma-70 factor (ECF subfamily)